MDQLWLPARIAELSTNPKAVIDARRRKRHSFLCCQQGFRCGVPSSRQFRDESTALVRRCRASYGQDIYQGGIKLLTLIQGIPQYELVEV